MHPDVVEERKKVFASLRDEIFKRQNLNSDNFDKSILTYSTGSLALSIGFLKDFIPVTKALSPWLLYCSWAVFVVAILSTMTSFIVSQQSLRAQLALNERYYLSHDESAFSASNPWAKVAEWMNYGSGIAFATGIVFTTVFVSINMERAAIMSEQKNSTTPLGALVPPGQRVDPTIVNRGTGTPGMQAVPASQPSTQPSGAPASTGGAAAPAGTVPSGKP